MWGRLDGAERLIAALLPSNPKLKEELTKEAHREIIEEEATNKIDLARAQANEVFDNLPEEDKRAKNNLALRKLVEESVELMISRKDCQSQLDAIAKGASELPADSLWRVFLESFVTEFRPFVREYIVPVAHGRDRLDAFKTWFNVQYKEGRAFTQNATLDSAVRINRVLGDMGLRYFPAGKKASLKRRFVLWFGRHLRLFTEAAIEVNGTSRRKQRRRLIAAYILSLLIAVFVCLPALLLLLSATGLWSKVGFAIVFIVTIPLALIPLLLTTGYSIAWLKLRHKLAAFLGT